jgi:hypothetical protein
MNGQILFMTVQVQLQNKTKGFNYIFVKLLLEDPHNAKIKNVGRYNGTSTPRYKAQGWCLINYWDNFSPFIP